MKSILLNVTPEETRMALTEDGRLLDFASEQLTRAPLVGNIYKGRVRNVRTGIQAAFIDIGAEQNAFLRLEDGEKPPCEGRTLLVQVVKEAAGMKGPRVTKRLSLPGRALVLRQGPSAVSRRIADAAERERLFSLAELLAPAGMGFIVRTAAEGQAAEALVSDAAYLVRRWASILARSRMLAAPALLHRDADIAVRIARDLMTEKIDRFVVDDAERFRDVRAFFRDTASALLPRVMLYEGREPLFRAYGVEREVRALGSREAPLPSGGFLVIDRTEALTVIDVNTGRYVGRTRAADTIFRTNQEAAEEVLRQLRLRDIGGMIIVDFIDMDTEEQKEALLTFLRTRARLDRTRTDIVGITSLGLVEITRKKARRDFDASRYSACPYCQGSGRVESPTAVAARVCRDLRTAEAQGHAAHGYEIEAHETVARARSAVSMLEALSKELGIRAAFTVKPGIHPAAYAILARGGE